MKEVEYELVKYEKQKGPKSPGVAAGMWAVVRITKEDVAFAETEGKAHALLLDLQKLQRLAR